jgi:hypothetical protein
VVAIFWECGGVVNDQLVLKYVSCLRVRCNICNSSPDDIEFVKYKGVRISLYNEPARYLEVKSHSPSQNF